MRNNPLALVDPMGLCTFDAEGDAVEDENGACYEGGFGGSVTVVAQAPEEIPLIWVSFSSGSGADQGQQVTPSPQLTESLLGAVQPAKTRNDQVKRDVACTADALVSFVLSTFVPGHAAAKTLLGAFDVSVNPIQAALGYKPLISADPTIPSFAAGSSSGYWLYQQSVFAAAGGQARLDRLIDLTSRKFSGAANAAKYATELSSLQSLAKAANFAGRVTGVLSAVSAGYDVYTCWAGK